jgi:hypothetical protein
VWMKLVHTYNTHPRPRSDKKVLSQSLGIRRVEFAFQKLLEPRDWLIVLS